MSGSRTPAYADGGRTVNPYSDGNRTAYGGTSGSGGVSLDLILHYHSIVLREKNILTMNFLHSELQPGIQEQEPHTVETRSGVPRPQRTLQTLALLRITVPLQPPTLNLGRHPRMQQPLTPLVTADLTTMLPPLGQTCTSYPLLQMFMLLPPPLQPLHQHRNFLAILMMCRRHLVGSQKHQLHGVGMTDPDMRRGLPVLSKRDCVGYYTRMIQSW